MKPSLYLGIDKSSSPESIQNQLRKKRDQIAKHISSEELQKFDTLLQKPHSSKSFYPWGDKNGIWVGSKEDFEYYEPVSESRVDKTEHMKQPLSFKQRRMAKLGGNPNKIDAPDFAAMRNRNSECTCGSSKGICKKCAGESSRTESKAKQVVNRLVGESDMDLLATADPGMAELMAGAKRMGGHDETDMDNPEERTEVEIANEILDVLDNDEVDMDERHETVRGLANELLAMHGQEDDDQEKDHELGETPGEEDAEGGGEFEEMPK